MIGDYCFDGESNGRVIAFGTDFQGKTAAILDFVQIRGDGTRQDDIA